MKTKKRILKTKVNQTADKPPVEKGPMGRPPIFGDSMTVKFIFWMSEETRQKIEDLASQRESAAAMLRRLIDAEHARISRRIAS